MSAASTPRLPAHPVVERIRRFRLLYAVAVNSIALVILVAIAMAARVREYRTIGFVEIRPVRSGARLDSQAIDSVSECIRRAASDGPLSGLLQECRSASLHGRTARQSAVEQASSEAIVWNSADLDRLRERMSFAVVPVDGGDSVRVSVMFSGRGTRLEDAVVRGFLGSLSDQVSLASSLPATHRPVAFTADQLASMQRDREALLHQANDQLQDLNLRLVGLGNELIALEDRQRAWRSIQTSEQSGSMMANGPADPGSVPARQAGTAPVSRFENPFFQASHAQPSGDAAPAVGNFGSAPALSGMRERFAGIPLAELSETFIRIEDQWGAALQPLADLLRNEEAARAVSPLRPVSRSEVYQMPAGLRAPREWLLLTVAAALAIGCVLASGVDARWHDPGFVATREIETELGVPVLGSLPVAPGAPAVPRRHWALRILKLNELIVFSTLLTLCVAALASPEIRQMLVENPLNAVVRIVWSVRGMF